MFLTFRAPETMTAAEQARLLRVTAAHEDPRDHVLYSMALGTGLRLRELLGVEELEDYLATLEAEAARVKEKIAAKKAYKSGAEGLFKS